MNQINNNSEHKPMPKGLKWFFIILWSVFLVLGIIYFSLIVLPRLYIGYQVQSWKTTAAKLINVKLHTQKSGKLDHPIYKTHATVVYYYLVNENKYIGKRVSLFSYHDNFNGFQDELAYSLMKKFHNKQSVIVYYNQSNPAESMLNRDIQWAFLAIQMIFPLICCGIGGSIVLIIYNEP
jgi:hypothetical protein